ncbi:hypothetical protein [Tolumonas lignilytica]|uniref:hypothetical protein n=1 Tax=Tolumonas lignilytica TaxID=1283284 RepID=UPI000465953B|nr:hypothetical protein [Tolumonas lignilytica]
MNIAAANLSITGLNRPDSIIYPGKDRASEETTEQSGKTTSDTVLFADGAEEAAEKLTYDQPSPKQSRAIYAYKDIAFQDRRAQIEQMVRVDMYA